MNVIECKNINKVFGDKEIFNNFNLTLEEGGIYGLLGRNGVGKTTLLNLITTRLLPDQGDILLFGEPAYENLNVLPKVCFISDFVKGFQHLKVKDIIKLAKQYYINFDEEYCDELLELFGIKKKDTYSLLSKGQATSIGLTIGLASKCPVVLFDEIYSGLDAVAREQFYDVLLKEHESSDRTFILSTHLIEEMDRLFTDVVILHNGEIKLQEEMCDFVDYAYKIRGNKDLINELKDFGLLHIKDFTGISEGTFYTKDSASLLTESKKLGLTPMQASLQDVFIAYAL